MTVAPTLPPTSTTARAQAPARISAWVAVAGLLLALATVPGGLSWVPAGAIATVSGGEAELLRGDAWIQLETGASVRDGDVLRTRSAPARLDTFDGTLSLGPGTRVRLLDATVGLDRGSVLLADTRRWSATIGLVTAAGAGTWRVDAVTAPRVAVYRGSVAAGDGMREHEIHELSQAPLIDGTLSESVEPLRYLATDPWDRRLLAGALAVDDFLDQLSTSLRLRYGRAPQTRAFYRDFVAVDTATARALGELAPRREGTRMGPPAGVLVGALMVDLVDSGSDLDRSAALRSVVDLRRQGAAWGLVAVSNGLGPDDVRAAADAALRRRQQEEARGTAAPVTPEAPEPEGAADEADTSSPAGDDPSGDDPSGDASAPSSDGGSTDPGQGGDESDDGSGGDLEDVVDDITSPPPDDGDEPEPDPDDPLVDEVERTVDETVDETTRTIDELLGSDGSGDDGSGDDGSGDDGGLLDGGLLD